MEVRGNIGEEVWLRARISEIHIRKDDIRYTVTVDKECSTPMLCNIPEDKIKFKLKPSDMNDIPVHGNTGKRGRPRKTTVDDMISKLDPSVNPIDREGAVPC